MVQLLTGWGRTAPTAAQVEHPATAAEVAAALASAPPRGLVARGLGRAYGDSAQNAGGSVLATDRLDTIGELDLEQGQARVGAGVSLDRLMRVLVPLGWFPPVTPGTRQVTVGGAVAADIHGKNHHRDGSFMDHVEELRLLTPALGELRVSASSSPEVFWATAGGMGLTGVVVEATIRLLPVRTSAMLVRTERIGDLDRLLVRLAESDAAHRYSVAWIDCLARGGSLGRSVLGQGDHAGVDDLPRRNRRSPLAFTPSSRLAAPPWVPGGVLNRWSVAAFNELWYRRAPADHVGVESLSTFFHPLDGVRDWNRIYGAPGFLQYQFVVPEGAEETLRSILEQFSGQRRASFLAVLKRFGPGNPGPLSFPMKGWTLALDLPAADPDLGRLLDRMDEQVAGAGGRIYLAKDSRLRPELLPVMYPDLPRWQAVRDRLDPGRRLQSDLARRLWPLTAPAGAPGPGARP